MSLETAAPPGQDQKPADGQRILIRPNKDALRIMGGIARRLAEKRAAAEPEATTGGRP